MTPTRFVKPQPVPSEPYADRLSRVVISLAADGKSRPEVLKIKGEAIALLREQARMIVKLEGELDDAYAEKVSG